jgi:putative Holliday junction resolvase
MARLLAIDYGTKRTGIAVTDEMQLIASGLTTIPTEKLISFLKNYFTEEKVELVIIGEPKQKDGTHSRVEEEIKKFIQKFSEVFSEMNMDRMDALIDEISATIILQDYLYNKK